MYFTEIKNTFTGIKNTIVTYRWALVHVFIGGILGKLFRLFLDRYVTSLFLEFLLSIPFGFILYRTSNYIFYNYTINLIIQPLTTSERRAVLETTNRLYYNSNTTQYNFEKHVTNKLDMCKIN